MLEDLTCAKISLHVGAEACETVSLSYNGEHRCLPSFPKKVDAIHAHSRYVKTMLRHACFSSILRPA